MLSLLITVLAIVAIGLLGCFLGAFLTGDIVHLPSLWKGWKKKPVIGYKRAVMLNTGGVTKDVFGQVRATKEFRGVVGADYSPVDSSTNHRGFHMYKKLISALNHPQEGSVFLEVVGYGKVKTFSKGYETDNQRIVQILVSSCEGCSSPAEKFHPGVTPYTKGKWLCGLCGKSGMHVRLSLAEMGMSPGDLAALLKEARKNFSINPYYMDPYQMEEELADCSGEGLTYEEVEERLSALYGYHIAVRSVYAVDPSVKYKNLSDDMIPPYVPVKTLKKQKKARKVPAAVA